VLACDGVRVRWIGHELHAELNITVDGGMTVRQAHDITEDARHQLLHHVGRLTGAIIHVNPPEGAEAHARTAHHQAPASRRPRGTGSRPASRTARDPASEVAPAVDKGPHGQD
jgi:Dimerisation domain of Zinc Transporter